MSKQYECYNCDAIFKIKNNNDASIQEQYEVYYCPYCGGEIEDEVDDESDDE